MKKKIWIPIVIVLIAVLFIPIPSGVYKDGGTREYTALTYKIVKWNRLTGDSTYDKLCVYLFPNNFRSIDSLWTREKDKAEHSFTATVLEVGESSALVRPVSDSAELKSSDKISFGISELEKLDVEVGSVVKVTYTGEIMESYPARIHATNWQLSDDLRHMECTEQWLDKNKAEKVDYNFFDHIRITKIYSNCFFASPVIPMPYEIKLNGKLSEEWCVGDQITCTYENTYYDQKNERVEADMLTVQASDWQPEPNVAYKPVIYLYPEKEQEVNVKLDLDGKFTFTYPEYNNGWNVTAKPDGTIISDGKEYSYLFWEGLMPTFKPDFKEGFVVKGSESAEFLRETLSQMGLTPKEYNEFIVYWAPKLQENEYNKIYFAEDDYTDKAKLEINPKPDSILRVFMVYEKADENTVLPKQEIKPFERKGFTVVEWGGYLAE